jgi:hypothetical protein
MTRKDCEQHGLEYFDGRPKKNGKVEVARTISGQPLLENLNSESESARRGSDTSVDVELFGPISDNIDSKDCVVERSGERACEPQVWRISQVSLNNLLIFSLYRTHLT